MVITSTKNSFKNISFICSIIFFTDLNKTLFIEDEDVRLEKLRIKNAALEQLFVSDKLVLRYLFR